MRLFQRCRVNFVVLRDSSMDTMDHRLGLAWQMRDAKGSLPAFDTRPRGIDDITHGYLLPTLALVVDLDREAGLPDEAAVLRDAIHEFFTQRAQAYGRRLRELFRVGRTSLVIGLVALTSAIALGDFLAALMKGSRIGEIIRESLTIGGWVSMWRPLEIFLYDWWPIRSEARLSDRLASMPVRIRYLNATAPDAWRADWPAVSPRGERASSRPNPEL